MERNKVCRPNPDYHWSAITLFPSHTLSTTLMPLKLAGKQINLVINKNMYLKYPDFMVSVYYHLTFHFGKYIKLDEKVDVYISSNSYR